MFSSDREFNEDYQEWSRMWINWINNNNNNNLGFDLCDDLGFLQPPLASLPEEAIIQMTKSISLPFNADQIDFRVFYEILTLDMAKFGNIQAPTILAVGVAITLFNVWVFSTSQYEDLQGYTLLYLEHLLDYNQYSYQGMQTKSIMDLVLQRFVIDDIIPLMKNMLLHIRIYFKDLGVLSKIEKDVMPLFISK